MGNIMSNIPGFGGSGYAGPGSGGGGAGFAGSYDMSSFGESNAMYSNLNSSTSFEPAGLPPTPQQMMGPGGGMM